MVRGACRTVRGACGMRHGGRCRCVLHSSRSLLLRVARCSLRVACASCTPRQPRSPSLPAACRVMQAACRVFQAACRVLQVACRVLQVACRVLQVACRVLQACVSRVAGLRVAAAFCRFHLASCISLLHNAVVCCVLEHTVIIMLLLCYYYVYVFKAAC